MEQESQVTAVCACEKTVVMFKQPWHLTSMKKDLGCWTKVFNLCFWASEAGDGFNKSWTKTYIYVSKLFLVFHLKCLPIRFFVQRCVRQNTVSSQNRSLTVSLILHHVCGSLVAYHWWIIHYSCIKLLHSYSPLQSFFHISVFPQYIFSFLLYGYLRIVRMVQHFISHVYLDIPFYLIRSSIWKGK